MGDFDAAEYFEQHPERWLTAVAVAGLAALVFARKTLKSRGFFRKTWNLAMLLVQVGAVVGLVRMKQQEADWG